MNHHSDSLSTVKAEIKDWERSFRSFNGKDPTIQDIKLQPHIANKYKLYKKLSKAAAQGITQPVPSISANTSSDSPSTPPRSRTRVSYSQPSLLLSRPRVAHTTAPLSTFNPFSPQRNKGKQREAGVNQRESRSNPFASPLKAKSNGPAQPRALSPDPFPILRLRHPSESSNTPQRSSPVPTSAISRARKRLRGEPVSPSPNKEKRRRVGPQSALPFTTPAPDSSDDRDDDDDVDKDTSFVTDSPLKLPTGGKSFKLLFDETSAPINTGLFNGKAPIGRTKSASKPGALFGTTDPTNAGEDMEWGMVDSGLTEQSKMPSNNKLLAVNSYPNQSKIMKATSSKAAPLARNPSQGASAKRPLSDTDMEVVVRNEETPSIRRAPLPPSPPLANNPVVTVKRGLSINIEDKAKTKTNVRRKKAKISESDGEADDDGSNIPVKIIRRSYVFPPRAEDEFDFDADSIPGYMRVPRADTSVDINIGLDSEDGTGRFEVDLPEKLRRVLALESAEAKARDSREEQVFKGLLYGQRSSHYDPIKGGNIWDAGEDDVRVDGEGVVRRDIEGEDDWEGEPVPWEVGEL